MDVSFLLQAPLLAGVMLQATLLVGFVVMALRHARLPVGAVTLLLGLSTLMMVLMREKYVADARPAMLVGALVGAVLVDVLLSRLQPGFEPPLRVRLFAALAPVVVYGTISWRCWRPTACGGPST
jgi:hypothetical protein